MIWVIVLIFFCSVSTVESCMRGKIQHALSNVPQYSIFYGHSFLGFLNKTELKRGETTVSCAHFFKGSNQAEVSSYRANKPLLDPRQLNLRYTSQAPPIIIKHAVTPKHVKNTGKYNKPSGSNKLAAPSSLFSNSLWRTKMLIRFCELLFVPTSWNKQQIRLKLNFSCSKRSFALQEVT